MTERQYNSKLDKLLEELENSLEEPTELYEGKLNPSKEELYSALFSNETTSKIDHVSIVIQLLKNGESISTIEQKANEYCKLKEKERNERI